MKLIPLKKTFAIISIMSHQDEHLSILSNLTSDHLDSRAIENLCYESFQPQGCSNGSQHSIWLNHIPIWQEASWQRAGITLRVAITLYIASIRPALPSLSIKLGLRTSLCIKPTCGHQWLGAQRAMSIIT